MTSVMPGFRVVQELELGVRPVLGALKTSSVTSLALGMCLEVHEPEGDELPLSVVRTFVMTWRYHSKKLPMV
jgi:hypothetical protein